MELPENASALQVFDLDADGDLDVSSFYPQLDLQRNNLPDEWTLFDLTLPEGEIMYTG